MEIDVTDQTFKKEVLESDIPVLVDFWAPWCMPCKMVAPSVEAIGREMEGTLEVVKVNVDDCPATASDYNIISIPTLSVFKGGKAVEQVVGALPKADIVQLVNRHLG